MINHCGKEVFKSASEAQAYAKKIRGKFMHEYQCRDCGYFHLTSKGSGTSKRKYKKKERNPDLNEREAHNLYKSRKIKKDPNQRYDVKVIK